VFQLLLIDLDGTVYDEAGAIAGAAAALSELRADGHVLRFVTYTDSKSTDQALVRTGKYAVQRDVRDAARPEVVLDSIADLPAVLRRRGIHTPMSRLA
jgi:ribonucleotide monophosphatase NagD (HAD superfamily)